MISLKTINQRIEKIEEYRDKLYNQRLKMPKINSYSIHEIIDLKYRQSKEYRIDKNLFGKLPFEYRVYQLFQEYNQELETAGAREKTAATINQEDNINIDSKTVKKLVRRVNYRLTLHENFEKKQDLIGYEKEVEYAKKAIHYINGYNFKLADKSIRVGEIKDKLIKKKAEIKYKTNKDVDVNIDFTGLDNCRLNGVTCGSLKVLSNFITKEEFKIALVNDRVEVFEGNWETVEKALEIFEFKGTEIESDHECSKCGIGLEYNEIGINKKLGRNKSSWLCQDCLDINSEQFASITSRYKQTGCNLFI